MYRAHLLAWLAAGGVLLACSGCTETKEFTGPGDMPVQKGESVDQRIAPTTYFAHGHLLERQGGFQQAVDQYRKALELKPDFVTARNRLGIALNKLGRHGEASAEFRRAIAVQPEAAYLHNNLGFSLYLEAKYSEAEATTRRALEIKASFPRARMNHALALAKLERFDEAFDELCRVGSEADAYYNMATLQTEAGRYADAAQSLNMALRLNPDLEAARQQLREIAVLAARQETVPVADAAAEPDAEQPSQPLPAAEPSESDVLAEAEAAISAAEAAAGQPPEQAEVAESAEQPEAPELPAEPGVAELPADADATGVPAEADAVELAAESEVAEPPPALDLAEFFGEPEPPGWFGEPEPTEPPAEVEVFAEAREADAPEPTIEAAHDTGPSFQEIVPPAWPTQADRPFDPELAIKMVSELITAIVNRSEALAAELWCELETYLQAAEQYEQQQPPQPPEPADWLN
ncbi:MAG TPA: tetratricopeptide repeat protein [Phycisphaerae bacterium]|nr:tetratricopeptide repeat protein [Phycisphaerae bacterium]